LQVLLLEDTAEQRVLITEYLELDGHEVQVASDGADGLAKFADSPYDLVITDRAMPEVGGDEVARKIKQEDPDKPVIMLTGFGEVMDAPDEMPEGVDFVLSKPVTLEEVRRAISRVMSKKRDWRSSGSCSDA
jgi:CheY-like chemotaxis protein